ncbi:MAG: ABC transporter ATP-binding protein [Bacilli bacterium]|nr:ABC transporter ATP-binding protein [Bacilli bacterium]
MLKIVKYLKPFFISIVIIIGLLFAQAMSDLALPDYMSNIINTGIQRSGIKSSLPEVIRSSEFNKIMMFVKDEDKELVLSYYTLLDKEKLSNKEYKKYVESYPALENESLYQLNIDNKDNIDDIDFIMASSMLIVYGIENKSFNTLGDDFQIPSNMDPFLVISNMPKEQMNVLLVKIDEKINAMPESMITQASVMYIKSEYKAIGINTDNIRKNYIIIAGLKMIGVALLSMIASVAVGFIASRIAAGLGRNLRRDLFNKVESFSKAEFDKFGASSLITRTTNDIQQVQHLTVVLLRIVFYAPILGIGGVLKVLTTDTSMGWIIGVAVAAISVVVLSMFVIAIPKFKIVQQLVDKLNLVTRESLTGMLVIRAFNTEKYEEKKFDKANKDLTKTNLFINRTMSLMYPLMMLIMNVITILIVWVGAHQINNGVIQIGDMMAFIQYTMQIIMSFLMITMVSIMLPRASVSAGRIGEVLDTEPIITDPKEPKSFDKKFSGYIQFNDVSFKYDDADNYVVKNISFEAKPGETTAFIGSTGCGKSTIVNLIPRFHDVTKGEILIDGINIKDVTQHDLRGKIGYVPQRGILFSGSIASNLKMGNEKSTKGEMKRVSKIAQALGFIESKSNKFNFEIAQGGDNVSGGQKQRLSIARALIKKPEIYIFDDTFSALDFKTDAALRKALKKETKDSTVLIVGQRISTIMNADQIIVLDKGKIVGIGNHKELMEKCNVYKEIAYSQLSKEELANG